MSKNCSPCHCFLFFLNLLLITLVFLIFVCSLFLYVKEK
uniref:Uncharacterized protein n=1 Tax=Arundo donax TaxID=35708 RepID=A0A0A9GFM2_ARUDO